MRKIAPFLVAAALSAAQVHAQVGIGTTSPNSTLDVRGSLSLNTRSFTSSTSITISDYYLIFTGTTSATATLPDATTCQGRAYCFKNSGSATLTIACSGTQTIEGSTTWPVSANNSVINLISNGTNWVVTGQALPSASFTTWNLNGNAVSGTRSIGTTTNYDLPFIVNNTERMRLSTSGFLGIGTTNPAGRMHLVSDNTEYGDDYIYDDYGASNTMGMFIRKARGTLASPANLIAGDHIGSIRFSGRTNGSFNFTSGSGLDAYYQGDGTTDATDLRFFTSNAERMRMDKDGNIGIGTSSFDATNPEQLLVDAGSTSSYNVISGKGSIDNYLQLNIQNKSNTANASSDLVATASNGNESANYVDLGINSGVFSNTTYPIIGGANNAYLYSTGNDFSIGNGTSGKSLIFFTGGYNASNERLRINGAGNVGVGTSAPNSTLSVSGSQSVSFRTGTGNYSIGNSDYVVINTGGAVTWTLPSAASYPGRVYKLTNNGSGYITLSVSVIQSGTSTFNTITNNAGSNNVEIMSDGSNWVRIN